MHFHQDRFRIHFPLFACLLFLGPRILGAYESPLAPTAIHDAWTLGQRNDQATAAFFVPYVKEITEDQASGLHISEIEVLTPFSQLVDASRQGSGSYTEQQAIQDYHKRGNTIIVSVRIMLPAAFRNPDQNAQAPPSSAQKSALRPENFWSNFRFTVKQKGKIVASRSVHNLPVYSSASKDIRSVLDGATVRLEYETKDLTSDEALIEVATPEGKLFTVAFDLGKLR